LRYSLFYRALLQNIVSFIGKHISEILVHTYIHTQKHIPGTHIHTHKYTHTYTHTQKHIPGTHIHTHIYTHTYTHTQKHIPGTHIHTHIYTHTETYTRASGWRAEGIYAYPCILSQNESRHSAYTYMYMSHT